MQRVDQGTHEARRIGTIIHAVIKGQVQGQTQSGRNGKVVDVSLHYGLQSAASQPKDGHFRVIDDGRKGRPTNGPRVGDGEGAPLEVVAVHFAMAHLLDQRASSMASSAMLLRSTSRTTGTIKPPSVSTATPI
jgi:hypothetical protein